VHFSAWSKVRLGWIAPTLITTNVSGQTLSQVETNAQALKLPTYGYTGEYFLIENRQPTGFDQYLPAGGLLVWHVDEDVITDNDCESGGLCSSTSHPRLALEQADGAYHLDCGSNSGDAGDPYAAPGFTSITPSTTPSSNQYSGGASGFSALNIGTSAATMTLDLQSSGVPVADLGYDDSTFEWSWDCTVDGDCLAVRFTPASYPAKLAAARIALDWPVPGLSNDDFDVVVYDDDGPGGLPGTALSNTVSVTSAIEGFVNSVDLSGQAVGGGSVSISAGDFYIAYKQRSVGGLHAWLATDWDSTPANRSYDYNGTWALAPSTQGNYGIRAVLTAAAPSKCSNTPLLGCRTSAKAMLILKDKDGNGPGPKDKLVWKWLKGAATAQTDCGDPLNSADYTLCLYTGSTPAPVMEAHVPATSGWRSISTKGYKYSDPSLSADGILKILLKGGVAGKARAMVQGKDGNLPLPSLPLDASANIISQLHNSDNTTCWEATFAPGAEIKNTAEMYKAKTP
jgi:hypothetical protein